MRPSAARRFAPLCALVTLAAGPADAIPATRAPIAAPADAGGAHAAVARGFALGRGGDCEGALRILDPLLPALPAGDDRSAAQLVRLSCLAATGRTADIPAVQRELAIALPKNPYVRSIGVLVAASEGRVDVAAEQLADIAANDPATLALIPANSWRGIAQQLTQADKFTLRDKVTVALARADWQPADRPDLRDSLAEGAIGALLADGQTSEAELLLGRVTMPELLTEMAVERAYQPLWPAIEGRMGPAQGRAADRFAAVRLDAFARTPDDPGALRDAVRAFVLLGRYAEASETAAAVQVAEGMDEEAVAVVRYDAQAMQAAGRRDAALARLRPFTTLDPSKTPDVVSGLVEFAETLDEAGREDEALGVARDAIAKGEAALSPWGAAWLRRTELCALSALGRAAEARAVGDLLKAKAADNQPAAIEGLLCARRTDEAAAIAIATLGTTEGADNVADQFQPDGAIWAPSGSRLRALWAALLTRPDVKAAFEKRARILPHALWPARTPRAIPRAPGDPADLADDLSTSGSRARLDATVERWPVAGAFTIARGAKTHVDVVVATATAGGCVGRGEATPIYYHGETAEDVATAIVALGDVAHRTELATRLGRGAARNAADAALWDLEARRSGVPAWRAAGLTGPPGACLTAYTISLGDPPAMEAAARAAAARHPLLKLKLAGAGDVARVAAVRRGAPGARLIVDANEAWTGRDVAAEAAALVPYGVELIEQPVAAGQDALLDDVASPIPLCADESVQDRADLARCLGRYAAVNVKLDKAGGLSEALALAAEADASGLALMVGCMLSTSLGIAPAFLLASRARWVDLDGPLLLAHDRAGGFVYDGGMMTAPGAGFWG